MSAGSKIKDISTITKWKAYAGEPRKPRKCKPNDIQAGIKRTGKGPALTKWSTSHHDLLGDAGSRRAMRGKCGEIKALSTLRIDTADRECSCIRTYS